MLPSACHCALSESNHQQYKRSESEEYVEFYLQRSNFYANNCLNSKINTQIRPQELIKPLLFKPIHSLDESENNDLLAYSQIGSQSTVTKPKIHDELMKQWFEEKTEEFHKEKPHIYVFSTSYDSQDKIKNSCIKASP